MKKSKWEWYGVKLLYECIISGEPTVKDDNYTNNHKTYEESIIVVRAQSFEQAYKIAEKKAVKAEHSYLNPYDQLVEWKYADAIDCFNIFDEPIKPGTEVYSRFLRVPANIPTKEVIEHFYPETTDEDDNTPDYNFSLRLKEFNKRLSTRCQWVTNDPLYIKYHDEEWGVPQHNDTKLFELLTLEGAQAGLSWFTILKKRENYRIAFDSFNIEKVANYDQTKFEELLQNKGIVRNRLKIQSTINNAKAVLKLQKEFGSFDKYIWGFVGGKPLVNAWTELSDVPAKTPESDAMSKDLLKRGFKFVGSTICYSFMQATGMVNDHVTSCFRYKEMNKY